jgi:hypothetical protein
MSKRKTHSDPWQDCCDLLRGNTRRNPSEFQIDDAYAAKVNHVLNSLPFAASLALDEYLKSHRYRCEVRTFRGANNTGEMVKVDYDKNVRPDEFAMMKDSGWEKGFGGFIHRLRTR